MEYTILIILLALIQYLYFTIRVGASRDKYHIKAPSTSGDETWDRLFRVQQNTLEQLIVFLPAAFIFGLYITGYWILIPGLIYLVGRQLYSMQYVSNPESRALGMGLTFLGSAIVLGGSLVALFMRMI